VTTRPPFDKVLIANRGEIAVRVARGLRDLGVSQIAVYSEADRAAPHVRACDEAYAIGPASATESYLDHQRVIEAARGCGAQAIHPGYGFLSESPEFARAVNAAGITWIGPPPEAMERVGDKLAARALAAEAGVPTVPGSPLLDDDDSARAEAERIGFPLLVKASAGGGGKGMRVVRGPDDLASGLRAARSEGKVSFGSDRVYLERLVERPRHVEIQIMADGHGQIIHLGERECSVQRRHQKVLEESPAPGLHDETRQAMGAAAIAAAHAAGYVNAGTCEFLLDDKGRFYFLEINARLQVEHPVTELCTGIDLVGLQVRIAAGEALPIRQDDVRARGHAIEVRIYAEDPDRGYLPSPGDVKGMREPSGPGVRVDSGIATGFRVTPDYDPILSKLIVWGEDRPQAIARLQRALDEYRIGGLVTNLGLHRRIVADARFRDGVYDTSFLDELAPAEPPPIELKQAAALAAALHRLRAASRHRPRTGQVSAWKQAARTAAMRGRR